MGSDVKLDREIRSTAVDFSFGELLNLHRDKEIVIRPEYQRLFRWSNEQRSRLIESVLLGIPIPPIFLIENDDGILELIDGLQRTSSVLQFLDHTAISEPELILSGCDLLKGINEQRYVDLPTVQKLKIKRSPIRAIIINRSGDAFVKYEMFKRLNTGGSLLSPQEIRNCSSRMLEGGASFYEAIQEMSKTPSFIKTTSRLPDSYKEKRGDEELVLRFFAVTMFREGYKGNIEEWLDSFMEGVLFGKIKFDEQAQIKRFERVFNLIEEKFSDQPFTRFNDHGEPTGRLAPAYFEAVVASVDSKFKEIENVSSETLLARIKTGFSDENFRSATGPGANTIEKLGQRISVISKYLVDDGNN